MRYHQYYDPRICRRPQFCGVLFRGTSGVLSSSIPTSGAVIGKRSHNGWFSNRHRSFSLGGSSNSCEHVVHIPRNHIENSLDFTTLG